MKDVKRSYYTQTPIKVDQSQPVDYKNVPELQQYIQSETGKLNAGRITGTNAKRQRAIATAIKRARFLALLPFCDQHEQ